MRNSHIKNSNRSENRRQEIARAAAQLFDVNGFTETTMQDIADHLNISKPTLYSHTKGKTQILEMIIDEWISASDLVLEEAIVHPDSHQRIEIVVKGFTRLAAVNTAHLKTFLTAEKNMPEAALTRYRTWSRKVFRTLRNFILDGQEQGYFRKDAHPTVTTFAILGYILLLPRWLDTSRGLGWEQVAQDYLRTLSLGLGILPQQERPQE